MKSSTRTSDIESNPDASKSVSGVKANCGEKTSRCKSATSSPSISLASIMLCRRGHSADLPRDHSARKRADDVQTGRNFERTQKRPAKIADRIEIRFRLRQYQLRFDDFAKMRVESSIRARFAHRRMPIQHRFNFLRKDFAPGHIDDRRLTAREEQIAVPIEASDVTRNKPAIAQNLLARHPRGRVSIQQAGAAHRDFAAAILIRRKNAHLKIGQRLAD